MKKTITLLILILFFVNYHVISQSGWSQVNSGTFININKIQFVNPYTGWDCGEQLDTSTRITLNKSIDGGITWISQGNNIGNRLISLFFTDPNNGWIGGADGLQKTTNGGNNFFYQTNEELVYNSIFFINSLIGWAAGLTGSTGIIVYTTNGGSSWTTQSINTYPQLYSVHFANSSTGWSVGSSTIISTTNSGYNWTSQNSGTSANLQSVFAVSSTTAWIVGSGGTILKTTNRGTNWNIQTINSSSDLNSIFFTDVNNGYAVGGNSILKTTNGGNNWSVQQTISGAILNCVTFIDTNTGFVSGHHGLIYRTTNGGGPIGIKPVSSEIPMAFNLYQNYPNPFNPSTTIRFDLPKIILSENMEFLVSLKIYDILGEEITSLVNEKLQPGTYSVEWDASHYPSGVYFYELSSGSIRETKRMLMIK